MQAWGCLHLAVVRMQALADRWREEADLLRRYGAADQATVLEQCASELDGWLFEHRTELLTLSEAAEETGLAYDTLQRKVSRGEIRNRGRPG